LPYWRCAIAQEGDELIILDQHGAHERVLYERLLKNPAAAPVALPDPVVVRLPEDLLPEAWGFETELNALGFEFEPFGDGALRVFGIPETVSDAGAALLAALGALAGDRFLRGVAQPLYRGLRGGEGHGLLRPRVHLPTYAVRPQEDIELVQPARAGVLPGPRQGR
jgi:hypothetical protein